MTRWPNFPKQFAQTRRFSSGKARSFTISSENNQVFFLKAANLNDLKLSLFSLDCTNGEIQCLVNPQDLKVQDENFLPAEEKARRERLRESGSGITSFSLDKTGENICFALNGQLWVYQFSYKKLFNIEIPAPIIDPRFSPDGTKIAGAINSGLYIYDLIKTKGKIVIAPEKENISYGLVDFISAEELNRYRGFWWSPDSNTLVVQRIDETDVSLVNLADPTDPLAEVRTHRYPFAGSKNPSSEFYVIDLIGNKTKLEFDSQEFEYVTDINFYSATRVHLTLLTRDQKNMVLKEFDLSSNTSKDLWSKTHHAWVEVTAGGPVLFENHLVSLEGQDKRQLFVDGLALTPTDFEVRAVVSIDKEGILLQISRSQNTSSLIFIDWQAKIKPLGSQEGFVVGNKKGDIVLTVSAHEKSWQREIKVTKNDKSFIIKEVSAAIEFNPRIEYFEAGETKISASIVFPTWFKNDSKLPVILAPYGGPHLANCLKNASVYLSDQWLADQGFVVIVADNRGTPGRGQKWEYEIFENWSEKILEDQITVLAAADKRYPGNLDLNNVGITGWSFGGYLSALAVLDAPENFHAAIAGAPVTDLRWYDTAYSERYLGNPNQDAKKYDQFSLINRAHKLTRPLLLIHGLADDNVLAMHSLKLSSKLLSKAKLHQFIPLSGVSHMTPQEVITENLLRMQLDFFKTNLVN